MTRVQVMITPNPSRDYGKIGPTSLPIAGTPTPVRVNIPIELVVMAMTYPSLDWNDVMRTAVRIETAPCNAEPPK